MKHFLRWLVFGYAVVTGHDEYAAMSGTWKCRFFNWLYDGDAEPMFDVQWPDSPTLPPATPECGDTKETDAARNIKNDADEGEAARKETE